MIFDTSTDHDCNSCNQHLLRIDKTLGFSKHTWNITEPEMMEEGSILLSAGDSRCGVAKHPLLSPRLHFPPVLIDGLCSLCYA